MRGWFQDQVIDQGRLPLFLSLLAFVITFLVTRTITRMIRLGKGPFQDNVSSSGIHVHHAVPGLIVLIVGAFIAVGSGQQNGWAGIAGVLVGIGTSLVLDEFALILRLDDVYWSEEGRISVEMVSLAVAVLGLTLLGLNPFQISNGGGDIVTFVVSLAALILHMTTVAILVVKKRYAIALLGTFVPIVSFVFAVRLARPESAWARRRYGPEKMERARRRAKWFDSRFGRLTQPLIDFVAGAPDPRNGNSPLAPPQPLPPPDPVELRS